MAWPSMEDKILPAILDLPTSAGVCSEGYSGLGYSAHERSQDALKSTWAAIPTTPLSIAYHVRGKTAFICADMDPRPFKRHRKGEECYTHSLPIIWVKYEFAPQQREAQAVRRQKEEGAEEAASPQASARSPLHPPTPGLSPRRVVRVRGGGGEADPLLHAAEEEMPGAGVQGGE